MDAILMELVSDLATEIVEQKYGRDIYFVDTDDTVRFRDEYQDEFNYTYCEIEDIVEKELNDKL